MINRQNKESVLLIHEEWAKLRYANICREACLVFTAGKNEEGFRCFEESKDYEIDYEAGRIRRCSNSAIKSYSDSKFFGISSFNHEDFNGNFGNYDFMIYISYNFDEDGNILTEDFASRTLLGSGNVKLRATRERLAGNAPIRYVVYGDSISTGQEALLENEAYFHRFVNHMKRISDSEITLINKSIGGETSRQGVDRFKLDVLAQNPDIVSIGYGMNDMCIKNGVADISLDEFRTNITEMVSLAMEIGSDVVLITPCLPNPSWFYSNPDVKAYSEVLRSVAREYKIALADVQRLWENEIVCGKTISSLLLNDINHPTSYGHYLYYSAMKALVE